MSTKELCRELKGWAKDDIVPSDLQALCKQAVKEIEQHRWIPVAEPPHNVLEVWVIGGDFIQTGRYIDGKWLRMGYGGGMLTNITHWRAIILPQGE